MNDKKTSYEYMLEKQNKLLVIIAGLIDSGQRPEQISTFAADYLPLEPTLAKQIQLSAEYMRETGERPTQRVPDAGDSGE